MPDTGNYAKVVQDWKQLLAATEEHAEKLPDVEEERLQLLATLQKAEEAKARQQSHKASGQAATQELEEILIRGRDVAMSLRFAAKLGLGARNEQLVQFGAAPLRRRITRKPEVNPPPPPEAPAPDGEKS